MGEVDAVEWGRVLCGRHIQNDWVTRESASHFTLSLNIPPRKLFGWFRRPQLRPQLRVVGSFIMITCSLMYHILCRDFWQNIKSPGWQPTFGGLWLLFFPKTKITFSREKISDHQWDSRKYDRTVNDDANKGFCSVLNSERDAGWTVWGPKVPTLKGTEASLSYI